MSCLGEIGRTKSWEAHEHDQQYGENESIDIGKSERFRKEGNARINKVSAMRPGLAKIIEKVLISWDFESPETDHHIAENACCINYADTWSPKRVHWLSKSQSPYCSTSNYECEDTLELYSGVARARLPITRIHARVASNPNYAENWPLFRTQDEWSIAKYIMEVLRPFRYWTLWMSKRHTVTLHRIITVYNEMFDHLDGVMRALAKKKTPWKEELFFAVKLARQKRSKDYAEVTPPKGMLLVSAHILNHFRKLRSFRKWDKGMDINPEDETSYTTQYQEAFLKYVENEYCAKHRRVPVNKLETVPSSNPIPSASAAGSYLSSFDPYELSSNDEEYITPNNVAETTPGQIDRAARLWTAARLYLNLPPEAPKNWGQINPNLNDYHSDPMEISSTFWLLDINDWWRQQEETHSKYTNLTNVARNIFSIIPHGVGVDASSSLGRDVIGWRQSKTTGETLRKKVIVRQFARANNGILAGTDPELDPTNTENDSEMKQEAEERKLHRMAKVHDFLEMWQGSQNQLATQKESRAENKQRTAIGYISDTEEIVEASLSLFQPDGAAAFKLSERSPLPPALSAKDLPGGRTQILNVCRIRRINRHPVESDEDSAPESISDTDDWLNWNGDLDNPNDSEEDCAADDESDIEPNTGIDDPECPEQQDVCAAPTVPRLDRPTRKSKRQAEKVLVTVNGVETWRNKGGKEE